MVRRHARLSCHATAKSNRVGHGSWPLDFRQCTDVFGRVKGPDKVLQSALYTVKRITMHHAAPDSGAVATPTRPLTTIFAGRRWHQGVSYDVYDTTSDVLLAHLGQFWYVRPEPYGDWQVRQ